MRAKHIRRKKWIVKHTNYWDWELPFDGMYSKMKIHCSCPMCSPKTRNKGKCRYRSGNYDRALNYKHSDMLNIVSMDQQMEEFVDIL